MKGYETQTALRAIGEAISAHEKQIKQHDTRIENLEKIVQSQAEDVMGLQLKVRELRDQNIKLAVDNGIPSKKVASWLTRKRNITGARRRRMKARMLGIFIIFCLGVAMFFVALFFNCGYASLFIF